MLASFGAIAYSQLCDDDYKHKQVASVHDHLFRTHSDDPNNVSCRLQKGC